MQDICQVKSEYNLYILCIFYFDNRHARERLIILWRIVDTACRLLSDYKSMVYAANI